MPVLMRLLAERRASPFLVLILTTMACGLWSPSTVSPGRPENAASVTSEAAPADFESEPLPPLLPQAILRGVDDGSWTLDEGLIAALGLLTGETPTDAFPDDVQLDGFFSVSMMARQYLEEENNAASQAEIERLMLTIAPRTETLEAFGVPADSLSRGSGGIASPGRPQQASCDVLWGEGFPEDAGAGLTCMAYESALMFGSDLYRVWYPIDWRDRADLRPYFDAALEALDASAQTYRPLVDRDWEDVNVIFTKLQPSSDDLESTWAMVQPPSRRTVEACPILVFPSLMEESLDDFRQSMAHELFHCVQHWEYGSIYTPLSDWWVEGGAEFFSNVVYPQVNQEYRWLPDFDGWSDRGSVPWFTYEAWIFWQHLSHEMGHQGAVGILGTLPTRGTQLDSVRALASVDDMQNRFHRFVLHYRDREIYDESDALLPISPNAPRRFDFRGSASERLVTIPFLNRTYELRFHGGREYTLETTTEGATGRLSARPVESPGAWTDLPETVRASCRTRSYYVAYTTTEPAIPPWPRNGTSSLVVDVTAGNEYTTDACLTGVWEANAADYRPYFEEVYARASASGAPITLEELGGTWRLEFTQDCTTVWETEDYVVGISRPQEASGPGFSIDIFLNTHILATSTYGVIERGQVEVWDSDAEIEVDGEMMVNGVNMEMDLGLLGQDLTEGLIGMEHSEDQAAIAEGEAVVSSYTCTADRLTFPAPPPLAILGTIEYRRTGR